MAARRITLRVEQPDPFGEVTMVPSILSGQPDMDMARAMAAEFAAGDAPSAAHIHNRLRQPHPPAPLSARVAALGILMKRLRGF
jgi:hypothetical protein